MRETGRGDEGRGTGDVKDTQRTEGGRVNSTGSSDRLGRVGFYVCALDLWDRFWEDSEALGSDYRGREIARQLTRSVGSISANIEEGYGRGFGKEYPQHLRIARGSARESKGWYWRARHLLPQKVVTSRMTALDQVIGAISKAIDTLESRKK
jgi:four helix bundle protein